MPNKLKNRIHSARPGVILEEHLDWPDIAPISPAVKPPRSLNGYKRIMWLEVIGVKDETKIQASNMIWLL